MFCEESLLFTHVSGATTTRIRGYLRTLFENLILIEIVFFFVNTASEDNLLNLGLSQNCSVIRTGRKLPVV